MIFEDRLMIQDGQQYVGISYLIAKAYETTDIKVIFAESNMGLKGKVKDFACSKDEELVLVFIDLVADNQNTWGLYSRLVDSANKSEYAMICIIPIPCMEFYFLEAFHGMLTEHNDYERMIKREHYTKSNVYELGFLKRENASFEKFCKCIRRTYLPYDANKTSFQMESRSFYNSYTGKREEPLEVLQKSWLLIERIPVFLEGHTFDGTERGKTWLLWKMDMMYEEFEEQARYYKEIGFDVGNVDMLKRKQEQHRRYLRKRMGID